MKVFKYILIFSIGVEDEVYYFESIKDLCSFWGCNNLNDFRKDFFQQDYVIYKLGRCVALGIEYDR